jgi:hypothetical protein
MPLASALLFVVVTGAGVGVGSVSIGIMMPSTANVEAESKRVKTTAAKSCCSFFMVFTVKLKLRHRLKGLLGARFLPLIVICLRRAIENTL